VDVLEHPVFVASLGADQFSREHEVVLERLLNRIAACCSAPEFKVLGADCDAQLTPFERIVGNRLRDCGPYRPALLESNLDLPAVDSIIQSTIRENFDRKFNSTEIRSFDGAVLKAYTAGNPIDPAIVIIPACGVPAKLCELWINFLSVDHFVLVWETRGLFGELTDVDSLGWDTRAQVKDLLAVMDHYGVSTGHVMGICGGAVVALIAAHDSPERISSLSVWYGDFELGSAAPKTMYQQNLKEVMHLSGAGRSGAAATHELFCSAMINNMRADLAHLIIYPYATPELLFRYGRLNGSIMSTNVETLLEAIPQRTLVVTSQDDSSAHPAGSRHVALRLPNAMLHVKSHGDHLSFYEATADLVELVLRFLGTCGPSV
jgi:pimeloyl-ACP methyl ester carboxylesterase